MNDWTTPTIGLSWSHAAPKVAATEEERGLPLRESVRLRSVLVNVLVASFYAFFLYTSVQYWLRTGSLVGVGLIACNTLIVGCLLTRKNASAVTQSIPNWVLASLAQISPLLLRPVGSSEATFVWVSGAGQVLGLGVMIASLMALNRSIGVVAANRGVKTRGPYAWVRHPLYAGEIVFDLSFLLSSWSTWNGALVAALILAQVVRALQEESLLLRDTRYVLYRVAVPYRLIPWVF